MIFTVLQNGYIEQTIRTLCDIEPSIEWVLKEEDKKYSNTIDESLVICLGHGELDHLDKLEYDEESYHYYSNKQQLDYFINVFRYAKEKVRIVVYKCNNGSLMGSHKIKSFTKII